MRHDVKVRREHLTCRGWFYEPKSPGGNAPAIIMTHGFSAVMEQGLAATPRRPRFSPETARRLALSTLMDEAATANRVAAEAA